MGDFTFKVGAMAGDTEIWVTLTELAKALKPLLTDQPSPACEPREKADRWDSIPWESLHSCLLAVPETSYTRPAKTWFYTNRPEGGTNAKLDR